MNVKEIREVLQLMADHDLTEIEIEKDGMKIKLKKGDGGKFVAESPRSSAPVMIPMPAAAEPVAAEAPASQAAHKDSSNALTIKSPMVGTFYTSPAPDQPAYASVGASVKEGEVLCIIEAMKLMNEIKSEMSGKIVEILVENGQPVEFDQPLFRIERG